MAAPLPGRAQPAPARHRLLGRLWSGQSALHVLEGVAPVVTILPQVCDDGAELGELDADRAVADRWAVGPLSSARLRIDVRRWDNGSLAMPLWS